jgi:hypothetical protein
MMNREVQQRDKRKGILDGHRQNRTGRDDPGEPDEMDPRRYTVQPLSGKGQAITVFTDPPDRLVLWGDRMFEVSNRMILRIFDEFFTGPGRWYPLGTSMTTPDPAGFGTFIRKTFAPFSPRHASAIAAIMVHEGFVAFRGRKRIELKKIAGKEKIERLVQEEEDA